MNKVWNHTFEKLEIEPSDAYGCLVTGSPGSSLHGMLQTIENLFENIGFERLYLAHPSVMSLHAAARNTGVVVESGHGMTSAVSVLEGRIIPGTIINSSIAGSAITEWAAKCIKEK